MKDNQKITDLRPSETEESVIITMGTLREFANIARNHYKDARFNEIQGRLLARIEKCESVAEMEVVVESFTDSRRIIHILESDSILSE